MTQPALLIVGGTHGMGKEIARHYAKQGWSVVLTGRDGSAAKSVATGLGGDTRGIALDLSEPELVADALADAGAVDHLVLAAIDRDTNTLDNYDIASARNLVTMKLLGNTAVVSAMRDRLAEDGSIVLFGGRAKDRPYQGGMTVGTVNAGISGMVVALALQLAPRRVNAIHPGIVADAPYWSGQLEFTAQVREATPTGRNVAMEDIVDAVDFLMRNRSVNGIDLYVDGGWLLQ
jgi:NAD(P)-dependent dehydrogenase (short-subunit alcohol dehydrogenase family)